MGMGFPFRVMNLWEPDRGSGCTPGVKVLIATLIVHFKMVILCEFHLDKNLKCRKKREKENNGLCVPGTHPRHCSHFHFMSAFLGRPVPIFSAKAPSWLRVQITVSLALDPTSGDTSCKMP